MEPIHLLELLGISVDKNVTIQIKSLILWNKQLTYVQFGFPSISSVLKVSKTRTSRYFCSCPGTTIQ